MLESQFYNSIQLKALVGIVLVFTLIHWAKHNPVSKESKVRLWQKICGGICVLLSVVSAFGFCMTIVKVDFPTEIQKVFSPYHIVRPTSTYLQWGYANSSQFMVLSYVDNFFMEVALAGYFFCFKKSPSKWWGKILKAIFMVLYIAIYYSVIDFHYFDYHEFIWPTVFGILTICIMEQNLDPKALPKKNVHVTASAPVVDLPFLEETTVDEDNTKIEADESDHIKNGLTGENRENDIPVFPNVNILNNTEKEKTESFTETRQAHEHSDSTSECVHLAMDRESCNSPIYCPYCGKQIEADSKFCKFCGRKQ